LPSDNAPPEVHEPAPCGEIIDRAEKFRLDLPLLIILFGALAVRTIIAWLPIKTLLSYSFVPDDAFYYADIARNIIAGKGITYDGLAPTNGFHPLHLFVIIPLFCVFGKYAAVHAVLSLAAIYETVTTFLIFHNVKHLTKRRDAALAAAAFFAFFPLFMTATINGLETALSLMLLAATFTIFIKWWNDFTLRRAIITGLLSGMMMLARTDNVLFFIVLLLTFLIFGKGWNRLKIPLLAGITATIVLAPWLLWNICTFDDIVQVSGKASPWVIRVQELAKEDTSVMAVSLRTFNKYFFGQAQEFTGFGKGFFIVVFVLTATVILQRHLNMHRWRRHYWNLLLLLPLFIFIFLLIVIHAGIRWFMMTWYFAPIAFTSSLVLGITLSKIAEIIEFMVHRKKTRNTETDIRKTSGGRIFILVAAIILVLHAQYYSFKQFTIRRPIWYELAEFVKETVPDGARVGAFNSGAIGYYGGRPTSNLDGLVNNEAFEALTGDWFDQYIRDVKIEYIADEINYFSRFDLAAKGKLKPMLELVGKKLIHYHPKKPKKVTELAIFRVLPQNGK
jgi:4-amino-4-deoxy-L-arabinose transferase-like glycosyltransferase